MTDSIAEATMPYRRGRALQILAATNQNGSSVSGLRGTLRAFGYKADEDTFEVDLHWLSRQGLIVHRDVQGVPFVRITSRGRDVILGDLDFPGIRLIED